MIEPLLGLAIFTAFLLKLPAAPTPGPGPGPSPECPKDMRLVVGTHHDDVQHLCTDPRRDAKDTHCFAYYEGVTAEEGAATEIRVCMDVYEAPNVRGKRPLVMKSFNAARAWCKAHHKRLCTEREWEFGCEGTEHRPLAYGWHVDKAVCNSDKGWRPFDVQKLNSKEGTEAEDELGRLWQGATSGSYPGCVSPFGIYDMMGNVEEWVVSRPGRVYPGALMGGFWAKPWTGCRGTNDAHEPTFAFYETGFRCCADALD